MFSFRSSSLIFIDLSLDAHGPIFTFSPRLKRFISSTGWNCPMAVSCDHVLKVYACESWFYQLSFSSDGLSVPYRCLNSFTHLHDHHPMKYFLHCLCGTARLLFVKFSSTCFHVYCQALYWLVADFKRFSGIRYTVQYNIFYETVGFSYSLVPVSTWEIMNLIGGFTSLFRNNSYFMKSCHLFC